MKILRTDRESGNPLEKTQKISPAHMSGEIFCVNEAYAICCTALTDQERRKHGYD